MTTQITSPNIDPTFLATLATLTGTQTLSNKALKTTKEIVTLTGGAPSATANFDVVTQSVQYYTANAANNFIFNIRGDSGTTLNSLMNVGDSITVAMLVTNGSTAYYPTSFQVDGVAITPKIQGGTAITGGNTNSVDIYTYMLIKSASATYYAFVSQTKFA